eukprot:COSAG02_NODE_2262_length_9317_cov_21.181927_2_plen_125_part_00
MRSAAFSPPLAPAGRPRPPARNGFRFLLRYGQHGGCERCGTLLSTPAHAAVSLRLVVQLLVAVLQVHEVGGGDPREMVDFGGAFAAEIEGWAAEEWVYGGLRGAAQPAGTLGRSVARWIGEWRL